MMKQFNHTPIQVVMSNPHSVHRYFAWPSVARLQDGSLAAVASGFRMDHICPFGKAVISFSKNEGKTWSLPAPVIDTVLDDRDAGIVAWGESNVLVTSFNNSLDCQEMWAASNRHEANKLPEGETKAKYAARVSYWQEYLNRARLEDTEKDVYGSLYRVSHDMGVTWGALHRVPVTSPHGPLVTEDGRILYIGRTFSDQKKPAERDVIQCWEIDEEGGCTLLGEVPRMVDDGKGPFGQYEPHAVLLPSGRILVHVRVERRTPEERIFCVYQSHSDDGGRTFSALRPATADLGFGAPAHILRHSSGVLISVLGNRRPPFGITVLTSRDEGETWEEGVLIEKAQNWDLGYPASCELGNGDIYTVWYANEKEASPAIEGGSSVILGTRWNLNTYTEAE